MLAMVGGEHDAAVRAAAFVFLREKVRVYGDLLPRADLEQGFEFDGRRVPLLGPQGIFKPAILTDVPPEHHDRTGRRGPAASV